MTDPGAPATEQRSGFFARLKHGGRYLRPSHEHSAYSATLLLMVAVMLSRVIGYLREAFGPLLAFLYGWAALLIFFSGGIAAVATGFADYVSYFLPALSPSRVLWSIATPIGAWIAQAMTNRV